MKKALILLFIIFGLSISAGATTVRVYPNGTGEVVVAYGERISVFSPGTAKVYAKTGYPNVPSAWTLLATVSNREYLSDAVSVVTTVKIEADAQGAWYNTGAAPWHTLDAAPYVQIAGPTITTRSQGDPTAKTVAVTLTRQELKSGIVTATHVSGGTVAYTLPTGTDMDGTGDAISFGVNSSFDWTLINLSAAAADTVTVTANTGHTVVGTMIVQSAHSTTGLLYGNAVLFRTRKTAANTFVTYRIGG